MRCGPLRSIRIFIMNTKSRYIMAYTLNQIQQQCKNIFFMYVLGRRDDSLWTSQEKECVTIL